MTYLVNISFDMRRNNLIINQNILNDIAYQNNSTDYYHIYELEGYDKHVKKSHNIFYCEFSDNINEITKFLKTILKKRAFKIDCVYDNDNNEMIYCSRIYNSTKNNELKKKNYTDIKKQTIFNICLNICH